MINSFPSKMKSPLSIVLLSIILLGSACPVFAANPVLTSATITPATASLLTGETVQLSANPLDENNATFTATTTADWSSSDISIATVDSNGLVTAIAPGTATITATVTDGTIIVTGTSIITVNPAVVPVLTSVSLAHGGLEIDTQTGTATPVGSAANFSATPLDQNGAFFNGITTVSWSSGNTAIATIDANGLMTAISPGDVIISATVVSGATSVTGTSTIMIVSAPVLTSVSIYMTTTTFTPGSWTNAIAQPVDQFGSASGAKITWSSSNPAVAKMTGAKVTAVSPGTAIITATAVSGAITVTGTITVTVNPPPSYLTSGIITPATSSIAIGATEQLTAAALNQNGVPFTGPTVTWSSADASIATVDANGLVTAIAPGTVGINASFNQIDPLSGSATAIGVGATVTVAAPPILTSIAITPTSSTLAVGSTTQISAMALDQNGLPLATQPIFIWTSGNPSTTSVDMNGLVTAIAPGTATITASSGSIVSNNSIITVIALKPVLTSITVTPNSPSLPVGKTQKFSVVAVDQFGARFSVKIKWSSSNTKVGKINATSGLFTAFGIGTTTITATGSGISGTTVATVIKVQHHINDDHFVNHTKTSLK